MAITLEQVNTQIDAAWAAFQLNETSFTVGGRTTQFRSLGELRKHIDWLEGRVAVLTGDDTLRVPRLEEPCSE